MKQCQKILYRNGTVYITPDGIKFVKGDIPECKDSIRHDFKRIKIIDFICLKKNGFEAIFTPKGIKSDFVEFILKTSEDILDDFNHATHFQLVVNKITALGYLLTSWKTPTEPKAVVIRNRHLGQYQNGKSLLAKAVGMIHDLDSSYNWDEYGFQDVNPNADVILIDDVDRNFKFQSLFLAITDDLVIYPKAAPKIVVDWADSPKFVLTTNDYIKGAHEGSAKRRIAYVDVSGHYNIGHSPMDDFGHLLFKGWDINQWQLFDNFMMECIMYYFRSYNNNWGGPGQGIVPPPGKV